MSKNTHLALALFVSAAVLSRVFFLFLPSYQYVYYDESIPGLMALDILDGRLPLVYWGHPYLGSLDALAAAGLFYLFGPSTLALRVSVLLFFGVYAWFAFRLTQDVTGKRVPLYICLFLILPPLALSEFSLSTIGGYMHTVAIGTALLYITSLILKKEPGEKANGLLILLGFLSGVGLWTFLMIVPYVATCYLTIFLKKRREFFRVGLLYSLAALALGSLPLWIWNLQNDFLTFKETGGAAQVSNLGGHWANLDELLCMLLGRTNEYIRSDLHEALTIIIGAVLAVVLLGWIMARGRGFLGALFSSRPSPTTLDLLFLSFAASVLSYVFSEKGGLVISRYGLPVYSSLPILLAFVFHRMADRHRFMHAVLVPLLLFMLLPFNYAYVRENLTDPAGRDMSELIAFLESRGIYHGYSHYTVAHPVTFESGGRMTFSDFGGFRNIEYLEAVDAANRVAIVTDNSIAVPHAGQIASQLTMLVPEFKRQDIGKYTVFYDFEIPDTAHLDITDQIRSISLDPPDPDPGKIVDRNISTRWRTARPQSARDRIVLELSSPQPVSKISLNPGPDLSMFPKSLQVEVSRDGRTWRTAHRAEAIVESIQRFGGKPRLFGSGQVDVYLDPEPVSFLRLGPVADDPGHSWTVAELHIYREGGDRGTGEVDTLAEFLNRHGDTAVITYPWVNARLQRMGGLEAEFIPLYTEAQIYREHYRSWDFNGRVVDFSRPNVFVIHPEDEPTILEHLDGRAIGYERQSLGQFRIVLTRGLERLNRPHVFLTGEHYQSKVLSGLIPGASGQGGDDLSAIVAELAPGNPVDGFSLAAEMLPGDLDSVRVFHSAGGREWRERRASLYHNSYWSDHHLLEFNPREVRWYLDRPVSAGRIMVVFDASPDGPPPAGDGLSLFRLES